MSVQVSYTKQIIFFLLFFLIIILAVEGIVRIWLTQVQTCEFENSDIHSNLSPTERRKLCSDHYDIKRSFNELHRNQELSSIHINNHGFRGDDISLIKDNSIRIFLVGGSTAFGSGSTSDHTTISGYLQQKYDEKSNISVEVINAGIHGSWSLHEVSLIQNKLIKFNPDIVIVYDGWNDLVRHSNFKSTTIIEKPFANTKPDLFLNMEIFRLILPYYKTPIALSYFLSSISNMINDKPEFVEKSAYENDQELKEIINKWKSNWNRICELGNEYNFKTVMSLQPIPGSGTRLLTDQEYENFKSFEDMKILDAYNEFSLELKNLNKDCSKILDLRNTFDNTVEPIYWDYVHTGDKGNEIVANYLYDELSDFVNQSYISNSKPILIKSDSINTRIESLDNFNDINLIGVDLSDINLSYRDLSDLQLVGTDFSNANLSNSNITSTNLSQAVLKNTNMSNTNLSSTNLELATLDGTDFSGANLSYALFHSANLTGKDLKNSYLLGIKAPFSYLKNLDLSNKDLSYSIFRNSDLSNSNFNNSNLHKSDLAYSKFIATNLSNVKLVDAILHHADFSYSDLSNSLIFPNTFRNINAIESNFSYVNMTNTDLHYTNLVGANLTGAIIINTDLRHANLTNAILTDAIVFEPQIENADLRCFDHEICN